MLSNYPTYFNNTIILNPYKWDESYDIIENENETEAGTDIVDVVRRGKLTVSASYKVSSYWAQVFDGFYNLDSFILKVYNTALDDYKEYNVRMRKYKKSLSKGSEKVRYGNGVYTVSFELIEF